MKRVITRTAPVKRSPRVLQLEGMFELPPTRQSRLQWHLDLPIEQRRWNLGLVVGPSGCGKSTLARELFGTELVTGFDWPDDASIVDGFPASLGVKEIAGFLSSVGFSSPPAWLRPFRLLSNGEQFRVTIARALAEAKAGARSLVVIDEFTSVVDRTVAKAASVAVAKAVRRHRLQFVALSCHEDIVDWLDPDWTYEPAANAFQWRPLRRRPKVALEVVRVSTTAWDAFKPHHYLAGNLNPRAACFVGSVQFAEDRWRPAVFTAVVSFPHPRRPGWREHRTVCLPDFQGMGLGNAMSEFIAGVFRATGKPYRSVTANPAMVHHRARSPLWRMTRPPSLTTPQPLEGFARTGAFRRITASFEYLGPAHPDAARALGVRVAR